jgi:hypothetical protein
MSQRTTTTAYDEAATWSMLVWPEAPDAEQKWEEGVTS